MKRNATTGLPELCYPKLRPCSKCGNEELSVMWCAGLGKELRSMNPFADSYPVWYVCCGNCMNNLRVKVKRSTFEEQQKALTRLGTRWNMQWMGESEVERLVFVAVKENNDEAACED